MLMFSICNSQARIELVSRLYERWSPPVFLVGNWKSIYWWGNRRIILGVVPLCRQISHPPHP